MPIEIAWTVAPMLIVFLLALILTRTEFEVRVNPDTPPPGSKPLYVTVIGHQWWWEYIYDKYDGQDLGIITANELHVPAERGRRAAAGLPDAEVGGCLPQLLGAAPGRQDRPDPGTHESMWFQTSQQGLFLGQCAEYCGTQHAHMLLRVNVDSPAAFQNWLEDQKKPAVDDPAARAGRDVFLSQSCVNCHRVRGTTARGTYAPDLTHLMSRQTLASGMVPNTRDQLRKWVTDPAADQVGLPDAGVRVEWTASGSPRDYLMTLK